MSGAGGRPPLPEGEAKKRMLVCRVRATEEAVIRAAAEKSGRPISTWMREVLLREARRVQTEAAAKAARRGKKK